MKYAVKQFPGLLFQQSICLLNMFLFNFFTSKMTQNIPILPMAFLTFAEAKVVAPPIVPMNKCFPTCNLNNKNNENENNETTKCVQI